MVTSKQPTGVQRKSDVELKNTLEMRGNGQNQAQALEYVLELRQQERPPGLELESLVVANGPAPCDVYWKE